MTDPEIDLTTAKYDGAAVARVDHVVAAFKQPGGEVVVPVATATAVPLLENNNAAFPTFSTSNLMTDPSIQALKEQGFPMGLAHELGNTKTAYPFRFWIVDNSGYVCVCVRACGCVQRGCCCIGKMVAAHTTAAEFL
jgi:hypothetical protein